MRLLSERAFTSTERTTRETGSGNSGGENPERYAGGMNNTMRATLIWSLGAVIFPFVGVSLALNALGVWYGIVAAVAFLLAGAACAAKVISALRATGSTR